MQMDSVPCKVRSASLGLLHKAEKKHLKLRLFPSIRQSVCDFTSTPQTFDKFISNLTLQTSVTCRTIRITQ